MALPRRSLVKACTWNVSALAMTVVVTYLVTGRLDLAAAAGGIDRVIKFAWYYGHERIWARLQYGRSYTHEPSKPLTSPFT